MITKQNLWFITLFSLILILGIYYISLPENTISVFSNNIDNTVASIDVQKSDIIVALKVQEEEKIITEIEDAKSTLLNTTSTMLQKNEAFDALKEINSKKSKIEEIEKYIKKNYNLDSCIKINLDKIEAIIDSKDLGVEKTNEIIQGIQSLYKKDMYITIKYQNK